MLGEIHDCHGFAGSRTAGHEWNAPTLKQYLGPHFTHIATDHRLESKTAVLETFYATTSKT